jgi:hypothetical protein
VEIRELNPSSDYSEVHRVYKAAFAGLPWEEELSDEEIDRRLAYQFSKPSLSGLVMLEDNEIVAVHWHDILTLDGLFLERGRALTQWVQSSISGQPVIVWERSLIVHPDHQRKGHAQWLRSTFFYRLTNAATDHLVLTSLRDDNTGAIEAAKKLYMNKTGVSKPAKESGQMYDYWFVEVKTS